MISTTRTVESGEEPGKAQRMFETNMTPWLNHGKFVLEEQGPGALTYSRRSFNGWQILVAIFLFPIGLLALLAEKKEERILVRFDSDGGTRTEITVSGSFAANKVGGSSARQLDDRLNELESENGEAATT